MELNNATEVTPTLRMQFRCDIEECLPDLIGEDSRPWSNGMDPDPEDDRDSIRDFAANRACDIFPNLSQEERGKLADYVADYFCGEVDVDADLDDILSPSLLVGRHPGGVS